MKDPYVVLGVDRKATKVDIKRAYRQKAKKYHPDLNPGDKSAEVKFTELSNAYEILQDDKKRQLYDRYGEAAFENGGMGSGFSGGFTFDMDDIFGDLFGDLFGMGMGRRSSSSANRPRRGSDISVSIKLTFKEAVFGCKKSIEYERMEECSSCHGKGMEEGTEKIDCPDCQGKGVINKTVRTPFGTMVNQTQCTRCGGTGKIIEHPCKKCNGKGQLKKKKTYQLDIPAGVDNGNIIPLYGEGNAGINGGPAGDCLIEIQVEASSFFKRNGKDLYFDMPISFAQAALGDTLQIPTLEGTEEFTLPSGTQTGSHFTLKGKGVADVHKGKDPGDLHFTVNVQVPKKLNKQQKEALRNFSETMGKEIGPEKSFWDNVKDLFDGKK